MKTTKTIHNGMPDLITAKNALFFSTKNLNYKLKLTIMKSLLQVYFLYFLTGSLMLSNIFIYSDAKAQKVSTYSHAPSEEYLIMKEKLFATIKNDVNKLSITADLSNFNTIAQEGLDFMNPSAVIENTKIIEIVDWSPTVEEALSSYLKFLYREDIEQKEQYWDENLISHWKSQNSWLALISWEVHASDITIPKNSVAILDNNWTVLFDTELINFVKNIKPSNQLCVKTDSGGSSGKGINQINNIMTQTWQDYYILEGTLPGSYVELHYKVVGKATVSPIITAAAPSDSKFEFITTQIQTWRANASTWPPPPLGDPCVWFGIDGEWGNFYQFATPYKSDLYIAGDGDEFNEGEYNITGNNGRIWSFNLDFSVSVGSAGIGITPVQNVDGLSLTPIVNTNTFIQFDNYTYTNLVPLEYRAFFWDGGSFELNDFYIRALNGDSEVGTVHFYLPINVAYDIVGLGTITLGGYASALNFTVEYLRGDAIPEPTNELTASKYSIGIGENDTIIATVYNNSNYVNLEGGSVSLNIGSLNGHLIPVSAATLPIDIIEANSSKEYLFIVQGNLPGIVTPQVNISNMGWGWPAGEIEKINDIVSIDSNIEVIELTGIDDPEKSKEFELQNNFPNPFNSSTNITYSIAKDEHVNLIILDNQGRELTTLVNEMKTMGKHNIKFNASNLKNGVYYYRLKIGDYSETKKMILLR